MITTIVILGSLLFCDFEDGGGAPLLVAIVACVLFNVFR